MTIADIAQAYLDGRLSADQRVRRARVPVLVALARLAGSRIPPLRRMRTALLTLGGLGGIDYAVWDGAGRVWGAAAIGVSLLVLEWLSNDDRARR